MAVTDDAKEKMIPKKNLRAHISSSSTLLLFGCLQITHSPYLLESQKQGRGGGGGTVLYLCMMPSQWYIVLSKYLFFLGFKAEQLLSAQVAALFLTI